MNQQITKTSEPVLSIQNIDKAYGSGRNKKQVLKGISFQVYPGQIMSLLGANGAGKTTLVKILSTLSQPDAGQARIAGFDLRQQADKVRQSIGLTGQFAAVDEELTARENLIFFAGLQGLDKKQAGQRADDLLKLFRLDHAGDQLVRDYSGGMKRRLDIAISIVVTPKLLFLDEPTTGLDPVSRREVWDMIKQLRAAGVSIFLTTQYLEEAEELADEILILSQGQIALQGSPTAIKENYGAPQCQLSFNSIEELDRAIKLLTASDLNLREDQITRKDLEISFKASHGVEDLIQAIKVLEEVDLPPRLAAIQPASLESIFIDIAYQQDQRQGGA